MKVNWEGMLAIEDALIVVEDDPTLHSLMTDILVKIGTQYLGFETVDDALHLPAKI